MKVSRRDLLVWGAGAAAGLMVTPVPWKMLDDTSKWSQNWPWIPQPARAPVEIKTSACTLCPNGCGLRVRMAAGYPVGVAGLSTHPVSRGALCPLGYGAHQLNWHPQRLSAVRHHGNTSSWKEVQTAFSKAALEGPVVIIDAYPGRAASSLLETFAKKQGGSYRVVSGAESRALQPYEQWSGASAHSLGYDLESAQTVLSFCAPMLDGWGAPGRFTRLWAERGAGKTNPPLRLIQVDSSLSRTASRAWQWISIHENSESALASGLARVLVEQNLVGARGPMPPMTLAEAADQTGISVEAIAELGQMLANRTPSVAIARDSNPQVAALNVLLGAVGARGGIIRRQQHVPAHISAEMPISNARAVLIDSSVPWSFVPQTDAEIFRFAAWDGGPTKADWLLPAPGFLEELTDVPTAPTSSVETYAIAPGLVKARAEVQSAAEFLGSIDSGLTPVEKAIHSRCQDLFRRRLGALRDKETTQVAKLDSAQKLQERLRNGAVWIGEPSASGGSHCVLKEWPTAVPSTQSSSWSSDWPAPVLPPLVSKLYIESNLRETPQRRNA